MALNLNGLPSAVEQIPLYTPEQQAGMQQLLQQGLSGLKGVQAPKPYTPQKFDYQQFNFSPIEQRELTRFQTETVPTLLERLTARPGQAGGSVRSSALTGRLGAASADLGERLAALKAQYNLSREGNLINRESLDVTRRGQDVQAQSVYQNLLSNLLGAGLSPQNESIYLPAQQGFAGNLVEQIGPGLFNAVGDIGQAALVGLGYGGPVGAAVGGGGAAALKGVQYLLNRRAQQKQNQQFANPNIQRLAQLYQMNKLQAGGGAPVGAAGCVGGVCGMRR